MKFMLTYMMPVTVEFEADSLARAEAVGKAEVKAIPTDVPSGCDARILKLVQRPVLETQTS